MIEPKTYDAMRDAQLPVSSRVAVFSAAELARLDLDGILHDAERRGREFADDHRVTVEIMALEFVI